MKTSQAIVGLLAGASLAAASAAQAFERDFGYALQRKSLVDVKPVGHAHHRRHHHKKRGTCKSSSGGSGGSGGSSWGGSGGSGSSGSSSGSSGSSSSSGSSGSGSVGSASAGAASGSVPTASASGSAPSASSSGSSSSGNSTSSSSTNSVSYLSDALFVNNVALGMVPDGGTDGGSQDTLATLNDLVSSTGGKHATFGQYAQAKSGTTFDGSQLLQVMDDLKSSGAIFEPAVMPTGGWQGLTSSDNSQAQAICKVMKQFTDEGIEVRLRFAHEVNWYLTDGTYSGTIDDFKEGWDTVAKACRDIAPEVKMFFTPNVANLDQYKEYYPNDPDTVDLIGIDYYPKQGSDLSSEFLAAMKDFHDEYCSDSTLFAIGETGLGWSGTADEKVQWAKAVVDAKTNGMQYLTSSSWFNYQKGYNFKILDPNDSDLTQAYISFLQG